MKVKLSATNTVDAKVIEIYGNLFSTVLIDAEGSDIKEYTGHIPDFFPGEHYGDYIMLKINIETGKILNWEKPSVASLKRFIKED